MRSDSRIAKARSAFTLIELMAVLLLVGLISVTAMLRFGATTRKAQFEWSLGRLMAADRVLRNHCLTCGEPGRLQFEIGRGRLERVFKTQREAPSVVELGPRMRFTRFLGAERHAETGEVTVDYSPDGTTETFAIEIEGPGDQSAWILFAGLTGQTRRFEDRRDVERIFEAIRPSGADAG
jgi:prepilin-type N-terminal cleavage/methylation domain-containing protein